MTKARDIASAAPAPSTVSATEIGYLDGVSSAIQTQIDSKIGSASAISPTLIDAKGDLIVGSAADTAARLAVGTNDYVLTADSSATNGVKWAAAAGGGAYTLLSTTTLSGASTTISISGTGYTNLLVFIYGVTVNANGSDIGLQPNSQTGNTNWSKLHQYPTQCDIEYSNNSYYRTFSPKQTGGLNNWTYTIYNINSSQYKSFTVVGGADSDDSNRQVSEDGGGVIKDTNAITSLKITAAAGSHGAGTVLIYGEK